ncbi:MAG: ATP-binding protein [Pyrinomonadaceae bacterium]|nr:ATP-binding protein [Phycisphaerales bacterium]
MKPSPDHSTPESASIRLPNRRDEIDRAEESLLAALSRHGYGDSSRFAVRLAVEEALSNAFNHGHSTLPAATPVQFDYVVTPAEVVLSVEDQGPGFTPEAVPDPTSEENLELPSGRGLLLMRAYMASVEYSGRGNIVKMVYRKPPGS